MTATPRGSWLFTVRVAAVLALLLPVLRLRLLLARDEREAFRLVRQCARSVLRLAGCRVVIEHSDRVPTGGPVMFVSNHVSLADAAVLLATLPFDVRFVANHVFAKYPLLGPAIQAVSAHIVDRGSWRSRAECGQAMVEGLSSGSSLLVFPEGGTSEDGELGPFRSGAFRAAARSGQPIVPMVIRGTRAMCPPVGYCLSNVLVTIEILDPLHAHAASRDGIRDLKERTAAVMRLAQYG